MLKIKVATSNIRGFLKELFDYPFEELEFLYQKKIIYQTFRKNKQFLYGIYRKLYWMIPFQIIRVPEEGQDLNFSYNRFLKSNQPYVIYLENPSALVNYSWKLLLRRGFSGRISRCLADQNLKAIVCMSKACRDTLPLYYKIPKHVRVENIYPFVPEEKEWTLECVKEKAGCERLECLFVSQSFSLKGGEDAVETMLRLEKENCPIRLTMITKQEEISPEYQKKINDSSCIDLVEFGLEKEELNSYYKKAAVFFHPSRWDSFGLVALEAMKYGCALVTTDLYALKELTAEGENGYFLKPHYRDWLEDNTPNMNVKYHHKETILSGFLDEALIRRACGILKMLCDDRGHLMNLCINSYHRAAQGAFSEKYIVRAWKQLLEDLK